MRTTLSMSLAEREGSSVVRQVADGQIGQAMGAERLEIGGRQMKRLMRGSGSSGTESSIGGIGTARSGGTRPAICGKPPFNADADPDIPIRATLPSRYAQTPASIFIQ